MIFEAKNDAVLAGILACRSEHVCYPSSRLVFIACLRDCSAKNTNVSSAQLGRYINPLLEIRK